MLPVVLLTRADALAPTTRHALAQALATVMRAEKLVTLQRLQGVLGKELDVLFVLQAIHRPDCVVECLQWVLDDLGWDATSATTTFVQVCLVQLAEHHALPAATWFTSHVDVESHVVAPDVVARVLRQCVYADVHELLQKRLGGTQLFMSGADDIVLRSVQNMVRRGTETDPHVWHDALFLACTRSHEGANYICVDGIRWLFATAAPEVFDTSILSSAFMECVRDRRSGTDATVAFATHPNFVINQEMLQYLRWREHLLALLKNATHMEHSEVMDFFQFLVHSAFSKGDVDDLDAVAAAPFVDADAVDVLFVLKCFRNSSHVFDCLQWTQRAASSASAATTLLSDPDALEACMLCICQYHSAEVMKWFWTHYMATAEVDPLDYLDMVIAHSVDLATIDYFLTLPNVGPALQEPADTTLATAWRGGRACNAWYLSMVHPTTRVADVNASLDKSDSGGPKVTLLQAVFGQEMTDGTTIEFRDASNDGVKHMERAQYVKQLLDRGARRGDIGRLPFDMQADLLLLRDATPEQRYKWTLAVLNPATDRARRRVTALLLVMEDLAEHSRWQMVTAAAHYSETLVLHRLLQVGPAPDWCSVKPFPNMPVVMYQMLRRHNVSLTFPRDADGMRSINFLLLREILLDSKSGTCAEVASFVQDRVCIFLQDALVGNGQRGPNSPYESASWAWVVQDLCDNKALYTHPGFPGMVQNMASRLYDGWAALRCRLACGLARVFESPHLDIARIETSLNIMSWVIQRNPRTMDIIRTEEDEAMDTEVRTWNYACATRHSGEQWCMYLAKLLVARSRWDPRSHWSKLVTLHTMHRHAEPGTRRTDARAMLDYAKGVIKDD
jgi:hypothetical protein